MYPSGYPLNRQRELLAQSRRDGLVAQARAMRKASRQVQRAARKLERAQATVRRLHGQTSQVY